MVILNFSLTIACFIHMINILNNSLNPEAPSVKSYEKDLNDIEFPLIFKFCINLETEQETTMLHKLGYQKFKFLYAGKSRYNFSRVGWRGHLNNTNEPIFNSTEGMIRYFTSQTESTLCRQEQFFKNCNVKLECL